MSNPDAKRWNERYQMGSSEWLNRSPKDLLLEYAYLLPSAGRALDAAAGVASNSLFLAERGLSPFALDISLVGLRLAKERFRSKGLKLNAAVWDLKFLWLPVEHFDVVANFCFLERNTFPVIRRSLKPGGILFFETYLNAHDHVPRPEYYLERGELLEAFSEFEVIHSQQLFRNGGERMSGRILDQLVARKPQ